MLSLLALLAATPPAVSVSEGLNADLVSTSCGRRESTAPKVFALEADFLATPDAIRIDSGDVLGASALGELIVTHDAAGFANALKTLKLRALALGRRDLATSRASLVAAAQALKAARLPFILSNLTCDDTATALCKAIVAEDAPPWRITGTSLTVVTALAPGVLDSVAPDRATGLHLTDPKAALEKATRHARADGADFVIAIYDGARGHELEDTLALADQLGGSTDKPDLLLALHLFDKLASVSPPSSNALKVISTVTGRAIQVLPTREVPAAHAPTESSLTEWSKRESAWLCENYAGTKQSWPLNGPLDAEALSNVLLDAFRERTRAEVAIFNRSAIRPPAHLDGSITMLDVVTTLPFDNGLRVTHMPGATLRKIINSDKSAHDLLLRGVSVSGTEVRINGRLLDDTQPYLVVTNDYLAGGGDGVITDKTLHYTREPNARSVWLGQLEHRAREHQAADTPIADPAKHTRWLFRTTADMSFSFVRVVNPASSVYTDTQLSRSNAVAFRGDIELRADADHVNYTWENALRLRYGLSRTTAAAGIATPLTETDDLLFLRDTAALRRWRGGAEAKPYVPVPFIESYLESEFTAPTTRPYHHLEWRPIAGFRMPLLTELALFLGAGLDWETLAQPGQRLEPVAAAVVVGGAALRPKPLFSLGAVPVTGEGTIDVSWRDPGHTSSALIRLHLKVSIPLFQTLALTFAYDLFARHMDVTGWGFANDAVIGLSFRWAEPLQGFAF